MIIMYFSHDQLDKFILDNNNTIEKKYYGYQYVIEICKVWNWGTISISVVPGVSR